ncbi:hypothetical protein GCM10023107_25250 [Actinoplanes octamycinicus]|nr:hypothetical protein Aoc01nite_57660 [Actinoplanes octamycinicus]
MTPTVATVRTVAERLVILRMGRFLLERVRGARFPRLRSDGNSERVVGSGVAGAVWRPGAATKMADRRRPGDRVSGPPDLDDPYVSPNCSGYPIRVAEAEKPPHPGPSCRPLSCGDP